MSMIPFEAFFAELRYLVRMDLVREKQPLFQEEKDEGRSEMRRILITNDDGIGSEGIRRLSETAVRFGEVWVVAPEGQRSAASHSITLHDPIDLYPYDFPVSGVKAFSCSGKPSDCVRVGGLFVMPQKPDLVLSGVNYGYNVASDIQYSATAGAAFEAAFQGIRAIAFSEGMSPCHEVTDRYLSEILEELLEEPLLPEQIFNVNFPECPLSECRGVLRGRRVSRGMYYRDHYEKTEELPKGGMRLQVVGVHTPEAEEGTDYRAILDNYVSVGIASNIS